jgi:hypothetical protein
MDKNRTIEITPQAIKKWRMSMSLSVARAASMVGVDAATFRRWEGGMEPSEQNKAALCSVMERGGQKVESDLNPLERLQLIDQKLVYTLRNAQNIFPRNLLRGGLTENDAAMSFLRVLFADNFAKVPMFPPLKNSPLYDVVILSAAAGYSMRMLMYASTCGSRDHWNDVAKFCSYELIGLKEVARRGVQEKANVLQSLKKVWQSVFHTSFANGYAMAAQRQYDWLLLKMKKLNVSEDEGDIEPMTTQLERPEVSHPNSGGTEDLTATLDRKSEEQGVTQEDDAKWASKD